MNTHKPVGKFLAAAVLCSLFTASPVWATSATSTVEKSNTQEDPYSSIKVEVNGNEAYGILRSDKSANDLIVYVSGDSVLTIKDTGPATSDASATAYGVTNINFNTSGQVLIHGILSNVSVTAQAGTVDNSSTEKVSTDAKAIAYGIYRFNSNVTTDKIGNLQVEATGGTAKGGKNEKHEGHDMVHAEAEAYGFRNDSRTGTMTIRDVEKLTVTATGGSSQGGSTLDGVKNLAYAYAYGIYNNGTMKTGNINSLQITATGGTSESSDVVDTSADVYSYANAYGIYNGKGNLTVGDLQGAVISAQGGTSIAKKSNVTGDATARAYGIFSSGGTVNVTGNVNIKTSATPGTETDSTGATSPAKFGAYSLYADQGAIINVGVNTSEGYPNANNKTVQLEGDISAQKNGTNNVILSGSTSSLQGNILDKDGTGTINITFTKGATWHPVFDNRYGSFIKDGDTTTYKASNTVNDISTTANLTLSDKAIIDLTWDKVTRDPATAARTMTLANLSGADGVLVVNTNLAQSVADQFIITNNSATSLGIDVKYDPTLAASGLNNNSYIGGNAKVLTVSAGTTPTVTGVSDSYNTYDYTPTITDNGDKTWSVTKLTITNVPVDTSIYNEGETYTPAFTDGTAAAGTTVELNGGSVNVGTGSDTRDPASEKHTLTIDNLTGTGGTFKVHTNLANNTGDEIILGGVSTATTAAIDVTYDPALAASGLDNNSNISGNALVLTDNSGKMATVTGVSDSYNTYDYTPTITNNGDKTWSVTKLTITNKTPVEPTNPTNPAEPTNPTDNPTTPTKTNITSPSRPMRDARHQRMALHNLWVNGELNNMEKRLGDLRAVEPAESGIWARYEYNKLEKGSNANLKYNYFQLGYDKDFKGDTGNFYRGVAFSYGKGDGSYEVGTGDLKEGAMTLYQTWVGKSGNYYDIVAKAGKLLNDYNAVNTANPYTSDYHSWAYSIGGEVGKRFKKDNGFFVEPQFEFTLGRINGADYTTSTGMNVNVDAQNSAVARIGVAVGKEIKNVGSYYAKASYFHDFGGGLNLTASDSTTNPFSYGEDNAKNWCIFTLGGAMKASKNCNVYGELSKYTGELSNNIQVNVGVRWSF